MTEFSKPQMLFKVSIPVLFFLHLLCYSNLPVMFSVVIFSGALSRASGAPWVRKFGLDLCIREISVVT